MPLKPLHVRKTHPSLPVVAPDFSYTMDLMFMTGMDIYVTDEDNVTANYKKRIGINNNLYNKGYNYVLVFVETTSRKAWLFPQKLKVLLRLTKTTYVSSIGSATKYHAF